MNHGPSFFTLRLSVLRACFCTSLLAASTVVGAQVETNGGRVSMRSPDGTIEVVVNTQGPLTYAVNVDGHPILLESRLGLRFRDGSELGRDVERARIVYRTADTTWENAYGKRRQVRDHHNQLRVVLREKGSRQTFEVIFRAFDDGIGFRYVLPAPAGPTEFILEEECTQFAFTGNHPCYAGEHEKKGFAGSQEWEFKSRRLGDLATDTVVGLPLLVQTPGAWAALTEADLLDWAGMWLSRTGSAPAPTGVGGVTLSARLAPRLDGQGLVKAALPHNSPWRVVLVGRQPGRLIESNLVLNLATPSQLADTAWIKPGLMAWDRWWSSQGEMDTATMKQFIQLAADMGWPYQLIDWEWYLPFNKPEADITKPNPAVDLTELRRFAQEKGVRLWLWLYWADVDRNDAYQKAFALYEQWGIAGVKIDFMDRDDQEMVNWYEKIARAAAAHHLMVNFHGAFKPTGLNRTLPNQITREGVLGNEYNKWSSRVTPEHKVTLPFTRFLAGPGDFTPGGFLNRSPEQFQTNVKPAQVQGTRAAELALFVVFDSPLGCVCDHPDRYRNQPGSDFLKIVPTVWEDTRVLDAAVAEHVVMVRRSGDDWYLGALTDRQARTIPVNLGFLGPGRWKLRLWQDAADCAVNAEHLDVVERDVTAGETLDLHLAPAGGAVARFARK